MRTGVIAAFDDPKGFGIVGSGDDQYFFHCTQIADGTRTIGVGTEVTFEVVAGHLGQWEAAEVTPVRAPQPAPRR